MADFAASIIGIVGAGTKAALVLTQVATGLESAGKEAQMIATEIRSSCKIFTTLKVVKSLSIFIDKMSRGKPKPLQKLH